MFPFRFVCPNMSPVPEFGSFRYMSCFIFNPSRHKNSGSQPASQPASQQPTFTQGSPPTKLLLRSDPSLPPAQNNALFPSYRITAGSHPGPCKRERGPLRVSRPMTVLYVPTFSTLPGGGGQTPRELSLVVYEFRGRFTAELDSAEAHLYKTSLPSRLSTPADLGTADLGPAYLVTQRNRPPLASSMCLYKMIGSREGGLSATGGWTVRRISTHAFRTSNIVHRKFNLCVVGGREGDHQSVGSWS